MRGRLAAALGASRLASSILLPATVAAAMLVAGRAARAQDLSCEAGDREVERLRFEGNRAFGDTELADVIVTTPSSAVSRLRVVGRRRCLDPDEFPVDVLRLEAYYRKRGYRQVAVDTVVRAVPTGIANRRAVEVTFVIREGRPLRVDSIAVTGLDTLRGPAGVRGREREARARLLRDFPLRRGSVFDQVALEAARDSIIHRLRNMGYPRADALLPWSSNVETMTVEAAVNVFPGPFARVGRIAVRVDTAGGQRQQIPDAVVLRTTALRTGEPFAVGAVAAAQRALYQTDAYRRVEIRADSAPGARGGAPTDTVIDLVVQLVEGEMRAARLSAGYATLDCFRMHGDLTDRYFAPWAQRVELSARLSRIGIGDPLDGARGLCRWAKADQYSDKLNYYLGATFRQSTAYRGRRVPALTLFTSVLSEYNAFRRRTTAGALFSLTSPAGTRYPSTFSYQFELGRTEASPVIFCAVFSACDAAAREPLTGNRPLGALGYTVVRSQLDNPLDPTWGSVQRLTARHSSAVTGSASTQRFNKLVADATWYRRFGASNVLVAHLQIGTVFGGAPPQERLFAGGPTTVRGFRQNELGPAVYLVSEYQLIVNPFTRDTFFIADPSLVPAPDRTIPAGGNTLAVANLELQLRSPVLAEHLRLALFTDVGEVWNRGTLTAERVQPRITPGAGVRVRTLFGTVRVDLGYNPYDFLSGAAYAIERGPDGSQALYCVSPNNDLRVTGVTIGESGRPVGRQESGDCPGQYRPQTRRGFFNRLNPSIWIGNAF